MAAHKERTMTYRSEVLTHRLDHNYLYHSDTLSVSSIGPACGNPRGERALYFSDHPTCPECAALPVMATCGAERIDANGRGV